MRNDEPIGVIGARGIKGSDTGRRRSGILSSNFQLFSSSRDEQWGRSSKYSNLTCFYPGAIRVSMFFVGQESIPERGMQWKPSLAILSGHLSHRSG